MSLYAMKGNRQYKIAEDEKEKFIGQGYKIAKLVENELVFEEVETEDSKEIIVLKDENESLKAENDALKSELEVLKEQKQGITKEEAEDKKKTKGEGK